MEQLQSPLAKIQNTFNTIRHPIESAKATLEKVKTTFDTVRHPIEALKSKLNESATALETQRNKLATLSAAYDSSKSKVKSLTDEFNKSAKENGAASEKTQELAKQLKDAESASEQAKNELNEYAESVKKTGKESEQTAEKTSSFADKLKTGLATAAKVGVAAIGAAAAGIAALTKASVENYAEYEQLVGGVDTLFKQASDTVQQYAANAYKTAGMSANEYMNTVTSFSASLIQSLGGDTEKAAVVADQAITDMSDNANKMGTSIDMIQNAYQGFAKQNYTMLDNLNTMGALAA